MKQLLRDPKLKIPIECSELLPNLLHRLSNPKQIADKKEVLDLLKVIVCSSTNNSFLINCMKQFDFLEQYLAIIAQEESLVIIRKEYKLLSLMLNNKSLCDLLVSKRLSGIIERVRVHCKKNLNDNQWTGLQIFLKALAKTWAPIPLDKLHELWEVLLFSLSEKTKPTAFRDTLAGLLSNLSPPALYPLVKPRFKEVIERLISMIQGEVSVNYAKLLRKIISLNDIATDVFMSVGGLDFLENILIPKWDPYGYKILAEICVKTRFIEEVLKTSLIKDLINKIKRNQTNIYLQPNSVEEEKEPVQPRSLKSNEENKVEVEDNGKRYIKILEKIIKHSKATQIDKLVELGALEALAKYLNPSEPALDLVYEAISDILREGRQWGTDRHNPILARAEAIGLRNKILQCTQQPTNPQ